MQSFQSGSEAVIEPAVDERVVAGAASGKPMKGKVDGIVGLDDFAGEQHHVAVKREPADGKDGHDQHQHLDGHAFAAAVGDGLRQRHIANGVVHPHFLGQDDVRNGDDRQWQDIEQNKGSKVQILPEEV